MYRLVVCEMVVIAQVGDHFLTMSSGSSGHRVTEPEPLSSTLFLTKRMSLIYVVLEQPPDILQKE